jgi:hypothetical protein
MEGRLLAKTLQSGDAGPCDGAKHLMLISAGVLQLKAWKQ